MRSACAELNVKPRGDEGGVTTVVTRVPPLGCKVTLNCSTRMSSGRARVGRSQLTTAATGVRTSVAAFTGWASTGRVEEKGMRGRGGEKGSGGQERGGLGGSGVEGRREGDWEGVEWRG